MRVDLEPAFFSLGLVESRNLGRSIFGEHRRHPAAGTVLVTAAHECTFDLTAGIDRKPERQAFFGRSIAEGYLALTILALERDRAAVFIVIGVRCNLDFLAVGGGDGCRIVVAAASGERQ